MSTIISSSYNHLTFIFGRDRSRWGVLVIDDKWDTVKSMAVGINDVIFGAINFGLGLQSLEYESVIDYWNKNAPSTETYDRSLLLIPWMLKNESACHSVSFTPFPSTREELQAVIATVTENNEIQLAVLLDMSEAQNDNERFIPTWNILNECSHPTSARSRFTRGGREPAKWVNDLPLILKQSPQGGDDAHQELVVSWFNNVRGQISGDHFQMVTGGIWNPLCESCHNPDNLHNPGNPPSASLKRRKQVCAELVKDDCYGVWRWAQEMAAQDPVNQAAPHRWLAAKAFQTTDPHSQQVPVTAVIGICEGVRYLHSNRLSLYQVVSPLYSIITEHINKLPALGFLKLRSGVYGDFAPALRDWLIQPEQFDGGNGQISKAEMLVNSEGNRATLILTYSKPLPESIFATRIHGRKGRVKRAWERLAVFGDCQHQDARVEIAFDLLT